MSKAKDEKFTNRDLVRKLLLRGPLKAARILIYFGAYGVAKQVLKVPGKFYGEDTRVLHLRAEAHEASGDFAAGASFRARRLKVFLPKAVKKQDLVEVLKNMAELERTLLSGPYSAGRMVADHLVTEEGRKHLERSAIKARKRFKESAFLSHLITLCRAKQGEYRKASDALVAEIATPHDAPKQLVERREKLLQSTWRAVDHIAREQMDWADQSSSYKDLIRRAEGRGECQQAKSPTALGTEARFDVPDNGKVVSAAQTPFKEQMLQAGEREEYLKICKAELDTAKTLPAKLRAIEEMLRTGVRHIPDYSGSYELADDCLQALTPDLRGLMSSDTLSDHVKATDTVMTLCTWLSLTQRLNRTDEEAEIVEFLLGLSERDDLLAALWPVPSFIVRNDDFSEYAARIASKLEDSTPKINRDMQHYFRWAMTAREYAKADAFFERLPKNLARRHGLLYYANILQRQARFKEALKIVREVHGQLLANPSAVNGWSSYSLIKRTGELKFLLETAKIYQSVEQPKNPKGVVLIAPRNIDHLRRYPLVVLLEFKRRGWAVVPIVEGLLPYEATGNAAIDVMNGAIGANTRLSLEALDVMDPVEDFLFYPENGSLNWGEIDLSHSIWEDAAINRRRHSVDYSCPELQQYLGNLADWTKAMARVLQYARGFSNDTGTKIASISLFSYRLPDSLFRAYCNFAGDADTFFYLAAANGYQNYFTNFSTNVSQRFVLRNMTRYPHVRSASFPLPENFEIYYRERQGDLPEILERFATITKVKRSTEGSSGRPPEADALDQRIEAWRARGGKVVCAFGKVVCDSGVPFDGGPVHYDMKDWINHCVRAVRDSTTLLLIKPHPHELNNQIATFPTEYFEDLIEEPFGENVAFLGHRWFDIHDMKERMDLGLIYNGTTTIELGLLEIPCLLAGHFAPIDYPIGHVQPQTKEEFEAFVRFEKPVNVAPDLRERAAVWLDYMANDNFTQPYRFHARPVTNKVLYPPYWFEDDLKRYKAGKDTAVSELIGRALGERFEPGHTSPPTPEKFPARVKAPFVGRKRA